MDGSEMNEHINGKKCVLLFFLLRPWTLNLTLAGHSCTIAVTDDDVGILFHSNDFAFHHSQSLLIGPLLPHYFTCFWPALHGEF